MNKIYCLLVILGILGHSTFCQNVLPFPYKYQNADSRTLFDSLFDNAILNDARNDTVTPAAPPPATSTSKPAPSTTEELLFIPVYEETIYQPNYYEIPQYPAFYNSPIDSRLQLDNYLPDYPAINDFPLFYSAPGIQSLPFFNPNLLNAVPEKVILPPQSLPFLNSNLVNAVPEKVISPPITSNAMLKPTNMKPSISTNLLPIESTKGIEITDADRDALTKELDKLVRDYILKKQHKMEQTFDDGQNDYKTLEPWSIMFPTEVSSHPNTDFGPLVVEHIIEDKDQSNETNNFNFNHLGNGTEENESQSFIETNQTATASASLNETDDSRKLDFNSGEEIDIRGEFSTNIVTDKSSTTSSSDLITQPVTVVNNRTSVNISKLNDRFIDQSTPSNLNAPKLVNIDGKNCSLKVVKLRDKVYRLLTCAEESYDGKNEFLKKTINKSNVTYFTEELPTTTTELTSQTAEIIKNNSRPFEYEEIETATLNTITPTTNRRV